MNACGRKSKPVSSSFLKGKFKWLVFIFFQNISCIFNFIFQLPIMAENCLFSVAIFMFLISEATLEHVLRLKDEHAITTAVDQGSTFRGKYKIYNSEERYKIGKYTSDRRCRRCSLGKGVLKNIAKFTGKHLH